MVLNLTSFFKKEELKKLQTKESQQIKPAQGGTSPCSTGDTGQETLPVSPPCPRSSHLHWDLRLKAIMVSSGFQDNISKEELFLRVVFLLFWFFFPYIRTFISQRENIVSNSQIIVGKISFFFLYKHRFFLLLLLYHLI